MAPLLVFTVSWFSVSMLSHSVLSTVTPTVTNTTGEYYIATMGSEFQHESIQCSAANCYVLCNAHMACGSTSIDASSSSFLTVECDETHSCDSTTLLYGPSKTLAIRCFAEESCYNGDWSFNDTDSVHIACNDHTACYGTTFKAAHAKSITVSCTGEKACSNLDLYVNNTQSVSVTANGPYALYQSSIHGLNAGYLGLVCNPSVWLYGDERDYACYQNNFYVPSAFNLSCYARGCTQLGDLYVASSRTLQGAAIYLNGCGECENAGDCAPHNTIYCDWSLEEGRPQWAQSDSWVGDDCATNECGCSAMVNKTQNRYFVDESECAAVFPIEAVAKMLVGVLIAIVAGSICCCVCIGVVIYFVWCKARRRSKDAMLLVGGVNYVDENEESVVETQQSQPPNDYDPPQAQTLQSPAVLSDAQVTTSFSDYNL